MNHKIFDVTATVTDGDGRQVATRLLPLHLLPGHTDMSKILNLAALAVAITALALAVRIRTDLDGWTRAFVAWSKGA